MDFNYFRVRQWTETTSSSLPARYLCRTNEDDMLASRALAIATIFSPRVVPAACGAFQAETSRWPSY